LIDVVKENSECILIYIKIGNEMVLYNRYLLKST